MLSIQPQHSVPETKDIQAPLVRALMKTAKSLHLLRTVMAVS
jgi:hypothetical protein